MMKRLLVLCALCAGCDLYWGGGGDDDTCNYYGTGAAQSLRDPSTGQCVDQGGGRYCCGTECAVPQAGAALDWAVCYAGCEGQSEDACLAKPGCRAAYLDDPRADGLRTFYECWGVAPSGPVPAYGACSTLGAQACSEHDDCSAVYAGIGSPESFEQCIAEPSPDPCAAVDCGPGYHCIEQCDALVGPCTAACEPDLQQCEQLATEAECIARTDCEPIYTGGTCTCDANGCTCTMYTYAHCEVGKI